MSFQLLTIACLISVAVAQPFKLGFAMPELKPRIVGGVEAVPGSYPHIVSLQWGWITVPAHFCAGTILNERWILTAGHCIQAIPPYGDFTVKAGKHNINLNEANEQVRNVAETFVHPDYIGGVAPNDVALIKLESPLNLNSAVAAIGLPPPNSIPVGNSILAGWGSISPDTTVMPKELQEAKLPIVDNDTCKKNVEDLTGPSPLAPSNVCTGPTTGGVSACSGDSGGPLMQNGKIIGIVSWGIIPCGSVGAPSVYTRVSAFNKWITDTINSHP